MLSYLASTGGTSEHLTVMVGKVEALKAEGIHRLVKENKDIRLHAVSCEKTYRWVEEGVIDNAASVITLQFLALHHESSEKEWARLMIERYTPDFPEMMGLYETNFAQLAGCFRRLMRWRNRRLSGACRQLPPDYSGVNPYTTLVEITQTSPVTSYWSLPLMTVRLYHDAMVAEVCFSQQISRFKASYASPNKKLHQHDEKHRINQFLADWLRYMFGIWCHGGSCSLGRFR